MTEESKVETQELIAETKIEASETIQDIKESIVQLKADVQESSEELKIESESVQAELTESVQAELTESVQVALTESVQVELTDSTESVKVEVQELAEEVEFKVEALAEEVKEMQELNQKVKAEMLESIDEIKLEVEQVEESESQDLTEPLESEVPDLEMVQPSELEIQAPLESLPLESPIELKQDIPATPISETDDLLKSVDDEPGRIMLESSYEEDKQEMQEFIEQVKINVQASSDQIGTEIQDTKDAIQDVRDYIGAIKANDIEIREYSPPVTVQIQESQGGDIKIVEHKVMEVEEIEETSAETPQEVETFVESVDIPVETVVQQELEKVIEPPLSVEVIDSLETTEPVKSVHFQDDLIEQIEIKEAFEEQSIISEPKVQEHEQPILVQQDVQMKFEQVATASMQIDKEQTIPVDSIATTTTIVTEEVIPLSEEPETMTFSTVEKVSAIIQEKEVTFEIPDEKPLQEVTEEIDDEVQTEIAEFLDDLVKENSSAVEVQKEDSKTNEQVKSELMKDEDDIDELFVLMMPPGQGSFDVKDHDDTEFDEKNAPRHSDDTTTTEISVDEPSVESEDLVGPALSMGFLVKQLDAKYAGSKDVEATPEIIVAQDPQPTSDVVQQSEIMSSSMLKELTEDEQEDSGFEVRTKENKSMDESTGEPSLDLLQSDKTDSLFQSSTLNESAQTLSEHTLEAELPSDYDTTVQQDEVTLQLEQPKEEPEHVEEEPELKATKGLKDSVHVTTLSPSKVISQEKQENVELIPNLNWDLKDKDELIPAKAEPTSASVDVQGLQQEQVAVVTSSSTSDSTSNTGTTSDGRTTSSSQEESSVPSSRMSERSGTQSSIELRTSSRSSAGLVESGVTSTTPSSGGSKASSVPPSGMSGISETSGSPQCSSSPYDEESRSTKARTTSGSSQETSSKKVTMTDSAQEYPLYDDDKSPTAQLRSSGECSPHSLPSSPRHLRRTVSNGVKKLTSEIFATDNDLSRSLEIVYSEPSSDERRKLSERYRHTSSSSGASNGSVNNEQKKVEKRKASVTQIRKTPDEDLVRDSTTPCSGPESSTTTTATTTDQEMKLQHSSEPLEKSSKSQDTSPIREKKTASPTKIQTPAPTSGSVQISSEDFTPMLQVECKTPECKTQTQG